MKCIATAAWVAAAALTLVILVACGGGSAGAPMFPGEPPPAGQFQLTVNVSGRGAVSSTPAGISCTSGTCSASFAKGVQVALAASAASGASFGGWSGACSGNANSCTVTLQAAATATATFVDDAPPPVVRSCQTVVQYGITYTFDQAYPCGNFANGDYWVTPAAAGGVVRVRSITPDFTGEQNGWQVNPTDPTRQGFDREGSGFDPGLVPSLPYAARPSESIVKAVSFRRSGQRTFLSTAAVLTVLDRIPVDNGATSFRPPYFGTDKRLRSITTLHLEELPQLGSVAQTPALGAVQQRYQRVQLDHMVEWSAELTFPEANMPFYGASVAIDNASAALRLMLNDTTQAKLPLAINYVQYGLDLAAALEGGSNFQADGGHRHGRKIVLAMSALLLNDSAIAAMVRDAPYNTFQEDGQLHYSPVAGQVLFGKPCSASDYWFNQNNPGHGSADCRDPYDYIDGGDESGLSYQYCCVTKTYVANALILRLVPKLQCIWSGQDILQYADRWVTFGAWTQPDPFAPHGNGALDTNASNGIGRWPANHHMFANEGYYDSPFADAMWSAYRSRVPTPPACR